MTDDFDVLTFDDTVALALAEAACAAAPAPHADLREALMRRVQASAAGDSPAGFSFASANDDRWLPHPIAGIRMKILVLNKARGYATLLLDVAPGTRFPPHHHGGAEECYVVSGSLVTCGRRLSAGDFVHADPDSDHGELYTDEGCRVILIVPPEEHLPPSLLA
ncbi:MAG TPA: cupin domain-containing protein [Vicinamibacterales bacterium]|nr:cupin domain-containing protein [Vicinamibacterales bacterium]